MKKFNANISLSQNQIINLLISAFGGWSKYWCYSLDDQHIKPSNNEDIPEQYKDFTHVSWCWGDGQVVFMDKDEYFDATKDSNNEEELLAESIKTFTLNEKGIARGVTLFAKHFPKEFSNVLTNNDSADTADIFLQCCLFGDVVETTGDVVYG